MGKFFEKKNFNVSFARKAACFFCGIFLTGIFFTGCEKSRWFNFEFDKEPVTFTLYNVDTTQDMLFNDPVAKEITRRTGVTLEVKHPRSTTNQDITLMITSGDYCDLIYVKSDITKLIDVSAVVALDDWVDEKGKHHNLIEEYCPNMKKLYGDELVKLRSSDGHIYTFGVYGVREEVLETSGTLQIQHAVLRELGYPKLSTLEEFADAIRAYKNKHPLIDGQPSIGLSLLTEGWSWLIDLSNPANYVIGHADDGQWIIDNDSHQATYKFLDPEISVYYKWLNQLYHDGTLDAESFVQGEEVWKSKIASGRVLALAYPTWGYSEERQYLIASGKSERTYAYLPITAGPQYKDPALTDYGYSGGWGISIAKSCHDVIRAVQFMDWMCSDEAQILVNWGIENVNYIYENGKRTLSASQQRKKESNANYVAESGVTKWAYPFPDCGSAAKDKNGDYLTRDSRQSIIDSYLPVEKETLAAYGATMWIDLFPQKEELPKPAHGQLWRYQIPNSVTNKVNTANDFVRDALIKCIISDASEFDSLWQEMVDGLKAMGMEETGKEISDIIEEKLTLWGQN